MRPRRAFGALVVVVLALAGCTGGGDSENTAATEPAAAPGPVVAMITHAAPGDAFWDLIRRGAEAAADKDGITLEYAADSQGDNQARLVDDAVRRQVDGIAVTLARPDLVSQAVRAARAAGVPVVGFNSGIDDWESQGVLSYFGQDERLAGQAVGRRIAEEGGRKAICVVHDQGQVALESRCAGVRDGLVGATVEVVNVTGTDMQSVETAITAKLRGDPSIDHVVTLGAAFALAAVKSVTDAASAAKIATFDTSVDLLDAIDSGAVQWAVDQQPYLQGYLAVDSLWLYLDNRSVIGGGRSTLTGPSFIDRSNADAISTHVRAGTR